MGRTKLQRVALLVGLLFLIFGMLAFRALQAKQNMLEKEQERVGRLSAEMPGHEREIAAIFQGKHKNGRESTEDEKKRARREGRKIDEKYGNFLRNLGGMEIIYRLMSGIFAVSAAGALGVCVLFWRYECRQKRVEEEKERLEEENMDMQLTAAKIKLRLEKEEASVKSLITDFSHQLKTPIASLKMSYEIKSTTSLSDAELMEFEEKDYEDVIRLEILLDSLLKLSRLETGMIQISPVDAGIKETLTNAVNAVYMKAHDKQIEIIMESFEDQILCHDPKWTKEALANILDNAIKYSPRNTKIQVRAEALVSYMLIEVEDEGIGIPDKEVHKTFQRFYRGKGKEVLGEEGSGVGLYLSRKIAEAQGGSVTYKPSSHRGSIFRVTLPMC